MSQHQTGSGRSTPRKIGHDDYTGSPEGIPHQFISLVIAFPERIYGTWWYLGDQDIKGHVEGWYIWIESIELIGATCGDKIAWCEADNLESGLAKAANKLWCESRF